MIVNLRPFIRGLGSYIVPREMMSRKGTGGSNSAEYCYGVWLRHIIQLKKSGIITDFSNIKRIAEFGPGDSLGIGIAGIYSGAIEYFALDVIEHADIQRNKKVSDDIFRLFLQKAPVPNGEEYTNVNPLLTDYGYPAGLFSMTDDDLMQVKAKIDLSLEKRSQEIRIEYLVPWDKVSGGVSGSMDLIFSQAVMEHVDDISDAYQAMYRWLRPGGIISHQIDFKAHETSKFWSGHWYISDRKWRILMHGRKYIINRTMLSDHLESVKSVGFQIKNVVPVIKENPLYLKRKLNYKREVSDIDLTTSSCLIQAVK